LCILLVYFCPHYWKCTVKKNTKNKLCIKLVFLYTCICYSPVYTFYILLHSELQFAEHVWEENERKVKEFWSWESCWQNIQDRTDDRVRAECWENQRSTRRRNVAVNFWKNTKWYLSVPNSTSNMNGWLKT